MEVVKVSGIQGHLASIEQLVAEEAQRPAIAGDLFTTSWFDLD